MLGQKYNFFKFHLISNSGFQNPGFHILLNNSHSGSPGRKTYCTGIGIVFIVFPRLPPIPVRAQSSQETQSGADQVGDPFRFTVYMKEEEGGWERAVSYFAQDCHRNPFPRPFDLRAML